ncbi:GreA/GreB family elongation factor [Thalassotalea euphylliae]|uniref:GreA/GreB family elongation factor n=1 Tax=Thalassotalea euphylliae TaxID=1655234 RepID=UPI00363E2967
MNKQEILEQIINVQKSLLAQAQEAAENAHKAAIDEQSKAETQYDTLAIEAAYLAEGQSNRISELNAAIADLSTCTILPCEKVIVGAIVEVEYEDGQTSLFFILPAGAGTKIEIEDKQLIVISPSAPVSKALLGSGLDDDFSYKVGNETKTGWITHIE